MASKKMTRRQKIQRRIRKKTAGHFLLQGKDDNFNPLFQKTNWSQI